MHYKHDLCVNQWLKVRRLDVKQVISLFKNMWMSMRIFSIFSFQFIVIEKNLGIKIMQTSVHIDLVINWLIRSVWYTCCKIQVEYVENYQLFFILSINEIILESTLFLWFISTFVKFCNPPIIPFSSILAFINFSHHSGIGLAPVFEQWAQRSTIISGVLKWNWVEN